MQCTQHLPQVPHGGRRHLLHFNKSAWLCVKFKNKLQRDKKTINKTRVSYSIKSDRYVNLPFTSSGDLTGDPTYFTDPECKLAALGKCFFQIIVSPMHAGT